MRTLSIHQGIKLVLGRCHQETASTEGGGDLVITGTDDELLTLLQDDKVSSTPVTHTRVSNLAIGGFPSVHFRFDRLERTTLFKLRAASKGCY